MLWVLLIIVALPLAFLGLKMREAEIAAKKRQLAEAIAVLNSPKRTEAAARAAAETIAALMVDEAEELRAAASSSGIGSAIVLGYLIDQNGKRH